MLKMTKRAWGWILALTLLLTMLPMTAFPAYAASGTPVESKLDFAAMNRIAEGNTDDERAASKASAKQALLNAGAVDADNLFLIGNLETIVNPGGYRGPGYFIQKAEAVSGETIQKAILYLDYYLCVSNPSGFIEVYVSADNQNYEKVFEQKEGKGEAFMPSSKQSAAIELPVAKGQTVIYVKVVMEHYNTYEGAGVSCSTISLNSGMTQNGPVVSDKTPEECTMVTTSHNFNSLTPGEVKAEDLGAVEESNMYFGIDGVALLSPRNGYEPAHATWKLEAAEGEPLHDCVLTIVGRTYYITENVKNDNYLKVYVSVDGKTYTEVKDFRANDNPDDTQRMTVDLTEVVKGYGQAYVRLEWLLFDSPHIFGIRSVTITGNTAGIDNSGEGPTQMVVSNVQSFTELPVGEVKKADLNAFKSANLMFGYNKTPLLTASKAGEDAYFTWKLTAAEGETFTDCYLTLIGKCGYVNADKKDTSELRIQFSPDAENYTTVQVLTPGEDQSDRNEIVIDLSAQSYGLSEIYVRVYWKSEDDPSAMGLRVAALVANAGDDYPLYTPELVDRVITDEEMGIPDGTTVPSETTSQPGETTGKPGETTGQSGETTGQPGGQTQEKPKDNSVTVWILVGVAAVVVIAVAAVLVLRKKKGAAPSEKDDANETP